MKLIDYAQIIHHGHSISIAPLPSVNHPRIEARSGHAVILRAPQRSHASPRTDGLMPGAPPYTALLDLSRARRDTPGAAEVTHLNNAGASLPPRPVVDAVVEHLRLEETVGGYEAAHQ